MRFASVAVTVACGILVLPSPASALGLGISTPTVTLANFAPGMTASGSGALVISGVLTPWTLKAADGTGHAGHLVPAVTGCSGSEAQTTNALTLSASGVLPTTTGTGSVVVSGSSQTVASGSAADTVNVAYSLVIGRTEIMRAGCVFSTTVTFTVQ